jgi:hypothetical protein
MTFRVYGKVWRWASDTAGAGWFFLTIEGEVAAEVRFAALGCTSSFGSIRVTATIGQTSWKTSLFPHGASGGFLLPLKADVRRREKIEADHEVTALLVV